ncbi:MAG: hypothetical protein IPH12_00760 [Saprospirales bacterium]|nr:hypothetical protein [Saprospirales bacterium]MBK8923860.1 hypothetical protein [Saprospirales bacterium]
MLLLHPEALCALREAGCLTVRSVWRSLFFAGAAVQGYFTFPARIFQTHPKNPPGMLPRRVAKIPDSPVVA